MIFWVAYENMDRHSLTVHKPSFKHYRFMPTWTAAFWLSACRFQTSIERARNSNSGHDVEIVILTYSSRYRINI